MKVNISSVIEKPITGEWGEDGGNIKILRTTNFTNEGRIKFDEVVTRNIEAGKVALKKLKRGDIIIEKSGGSPNQPVGRVVFFDENETYLCNNFTSILRPVTNKIHPKYLHYILFCNHKFGVTNSFQNKTTGIINLKLQRYIDEIQIPLPPLSIQKKIADILDAADLYRQKTKTLIEKYNQLAQSLFLEMFGGLKGEKCTLDLCCELNPKKSEISHLERTTIVSFVPMASVSEKGELQLEDNRELCDVWNGFTFFKENDVVFAKITPCMENGKGAIMKNLKNGIGFGTTEFHVLRPIEKVSSPTWLYYLTTNEKFRKEAEKNMTGSAGQKRVPIDFFRKYQVICPPISLQTQFADRIQLIEAQKQQAQSTLQKAETLFNSLLQRAFNGELVN